MTSFCLSAGMSFLAMNYMVSVPSTIPGRPCANRPISVPCCARRNSWYSGCWPAGDILTDLLFLKYNTAPASSHNNGIGYVRMMAWRGLILTAGNVDICTHDNIALSIML